MILAAAALTVLIVVLAMSYHHSISIITRSLTSASTEMTPLLLDRIGAKVPFFGKRTAFLSAMVERLKQSDNDHKTRYKILTENVAAAVILHESDGTILWCSPFTEVLTGFPLSEIYRAKDTFLRTNVHEDDRETVERSLKIVSTGEPFQCRYRLYHKSGMALWLETRTVPIIDNSSDNYVALSISIDVTAQVMNLNEFTYMISHDLKAPILTISGMLGILEDDEAVKSNTSLSEPLTYIRKATRRLQDLVHGVLELAKISASDRTLEPVALKEVLNEVLEDHRLQIEQSVVTVTAIEELPVVLGNKIQLYQIFSNLIGNAIKYQRVDRPLIVSVGTERASSRRRTSITVSDNGRGITPDKIDTIFKPFNRAGEDTIEGTGVGLASVKKLVERLGGSIQVESQVDSGTSFTIELRRAPDS